MRKKGTLDCFCLVRYYRSEPSCRVGVRMPAAEAGLYPRGLPPVIFENCSMQVSGRKATLYGTPSTATTHHQSHDSPQQVTLASLAARLNDTREISRVMTYTALAAETEVIENLREVLDGLQVSGRGVEFRSGGFRVVEATGKQPLPTRRSLKAPAWSVLMAGFGAGRMLRFPPWRYPACHITPS